VEFIEHNLLIFTAPNLHLMITKTPTTLSSIELLISPIRKFFLFYLISYPRHNSPFSLHSTLGALLHLLKSSLGTGILAMPNAFGNAGLLFGSIMTIIVGVLCTHCVWILVSFLPLETSYEVCSSFS
jgi:hypothetical protein